MSSDKYCCVPGCKESGGTHRVLHGFPNPEKDKQRFNNWLYAIGGDILGLENERIFKYRRVCHSHFEDKYLCRNNRISNIALPTLNMPAPFLLKRSTSVTRKPLQQILELPSTSSDPISKYEYLPPTSMNIGTEMVQKENINPDTPVHEFNTTIPLGNPLTPKKSLGENRVVRKTTKKVFLTNTEKDLYQKLVASRIKISKIKNKVRKQSAHIKAAKKVASLGPAVLDTLENCTSTAKLLMRMQWREDRKKEKGRRFTLQEKIAALSILKQSPKGYRFFRKIFILPAQQNRNRNCSGKTETVPSVTNWVWTLQGLQILIKKLKEDFNVSSIWLRHLNQDPLENFFGAVRSHGYRNTNPTCDQFESAFATIIINNISSVHTRGNCEGDFCDALYPLIVNENAKAPSTSSSFDFAKVIDFNCTPLEVKEKDPRKIAPIQYMSGYFLKKAKSNIFKSCPDCNCDLASKNETEYIKYREYAGRRWLCTPSKELVQLISNMQDIINEVMTQNIEIYNLKDILKTAIVILLDFKFIKCNNHKIKLTDYLIDIVIRCMVFNYCKNINKILAGRRQVDDDEDNLQIKAKKYNKCYKRLK